MFIIIIVIIIIIRNTMLGLQLHCHYNYNRDLLCAPYKQNDGALHCHNVLTIKAVLNKKVLRRLLKVSIEHVVVFSSDGS